MVATPIDDDATYQLRELVRSGRFAEALAVASAARGSAPVASWRAENLVGTPEQVAETVETYRALGCSGFVPWCADYPSDESLRLFAEKVMPHFR